MDIGKIEKQVVRVVSDYMEWCRANDCTHAHCPRECEKPQPIIDDQGVAICGRCWCVDGERVPVEPCRPETCGD